MKRAVATTAVITSPITAGVITRLITAGIIIRPIVGAVITRPIATLAIIFFTHCQILAQSAIPNGTFALKNVHTGMYVRIKDANGANGTPIVAYSPVNWKCVTWQFQPAADGSYTLKNLFSGKTLQPMKGELKAGVAMEEQPLGEGRPRFELIPAGKGQYLIKVKGSELYLTPSDPGGETNSSMVLQPKNEGDLQKWTLVEQHPTM